MACLFFGLLSSPAALGQSDPSATERLDAAQEPTVFSVLTLAKEIAETAKLEISQSANEVRNEVVRLPLRYRVALTIKKTGYELPFGDYVDTAIRAWEVWDPRRSSPDQELIGENARLTAEARIAFFVGDPPRAERLLRERSCKPPGPLFGYCYFPDFAIPMQFLEWELEVGRVSEALRRINETNWTAKENAKSKEFTEAAKTFYARQIVQAFIDIGRAKDGFDFLSDLRPVASSDKASIAKIYWQVGAIQEGRQLMREAAEAAFAEAEADSKKPPVGIAAAQIAMGDSEGGIATLRRLRLFEEHRLLKIRADLAGQFAFAGLDAEAFSLLNATSVDHWTLSSIIVGQARRGDLEAAFRTLDLLRRLPPMPFLSPPGINLNTATLSTAVFSILRNAARAGDAHAFGQGVVAYRELFPRRSWHRSTFLRDLARAGKGAIALEYALGAQDLDEKIQSLCMVAEGMAGFTDPDYDPLAFVVR